MNETVALVGGNALVTVVTEPADNAGDRRAPATILLNAGMVHRVGPSRQTVRLARRLAARGSLVARFDRSGIGDTVFRRDKLPWQESAVQETREVMDELERKYGARSFVLLGLCSGAITAFDAAVEDPRVVGVGMINARGYDVGAEWNRHAMNRGWVRDYGKTLLRPGSWWRAFTGKSQYRRFATVMFRHVRSRLFRSEEIETVSEGLAGRVVELVDRGVRLLFVHSAGDHAQDYFDLILERERESLEASGRFDSAVVTGTDHTFTLLRSQRELFEVIENWFAADGWTEEGHLAASRGITA